MNKYNGMNCSYEYDLIKHQGKTRQHLGTNRKMNAMERKVEDRHFICVYGKIKNKGHIICCTWYTDNWEKLMNSSKQLK